MLMDPAEQETQNTQINQTPSNQMSFTYGWDKGYATTQAGFDHSTLNHKGQATKLKARESDTRAEPDVFKSFVSKL